MTGRQAESRRQSQKATRKGVLDGMQGPLRVVAIARLDDRIHAVPVRDLAHPAVYPRCYRSGAQAGQKALRGDRRATNGTRKSQFALREAGSNAVRVVPPIVPSHGEARHECGRG